MTTAAVARWMTPFSGPIQRSWLSPTSSRQKAPDVREQLRLGPAEDQRPERLDRGHDDLGAATDGECEAVAFEAIPASVRRIT